MIAKGTRIQYKGYTLRSLHELAWAEYLDARGLAWEYEAVRFQKGRSSYTPDFGLENGAVYLEVKATFTQKVNALSLCTAPLMFIVGLPTRPTIRLVECGALLPPRLTDFATAYALAKNGLPAWIAR